MGPGRPRRARLRTCSEREAQALARCQGHTELCNVSTVPPRRRDHRRSHALVNLFEQRLEGWLATRKKGKSPILFGTKFASRIPVTFCPILARNLRHLRISGLEMSLWQVAVWRVRK